MTFNVETVRNLPIKEIRLIPVYLFRGLEPQDNVISLVDVRTVLYLRLRGLSPLNLTVDAAA